VRFQEVLDNARLAEELGFDGFGVGELKYPTRAGRGARLAPHPTTCRLANWKPYRLTRRREPIIGYLTQIARPPSGAAGPGGNVTRYSVGASVLGLSPRRGRRNMQTTRPNSASK
jgi:hypothetical protein